MRSRGQVNSFRRHQRQAQGNISLGSPGRQLVEVGLQGQLPGRVHLQQAAGDPAFAPAQGRDQRIMAVGLVLRPIQQARQDLRVGEVDQRQQAGIALVFAGIIQLVEQQDGDGQIAQLAEQVNGSEPQISVIALALRDQVSQALRQGIARAELAGGRGWIMPAFG